MQLSVSTTTDASLKAGVCLSSSTFGAAGTFSLIVGAIQITTVTGVWDIVSPTVRVNVATGTQAVFAFGSVTSLSGTISASSITFSSIRARQL